MALNIHTKRICGRVEVGGGTWSWIWMPPLSVAEEAFRHRPFLCLKVLEPKAPTPAGKLVCPTQGLPGPGGFGVPSLSGSLSNNSSHLRGMCRYSPAWRQGHGRADKGESVFWPFLNLHFSSFLHSTSDALPCCPCFSFCSTSPSNIMTLWSYVKKN